MARFIIKGGFERVFRYDLQEGATTVGREADNGLVLPNNSVSRNHARLVRTGDQVTIEDTGSSNGMLVNGSKLQTASIQPGDTLKLGQFSLIRVGKDQTQFEGRYIEYLDEYRPSATAAKAATMMMGKEWKTDEFRSDENIRIQSVADPNRYWDLGNTPITIGRGGVIEVGGLLSGGIIAEIQKYIGGHGGTLVRKKRFATIKHNGKSVEQVSVSMGDSLTLGDTDFVLARPT